MEYYDFKFLGLQRKLPIIYLSKNLGVASLNLLGDSELVKKSAENLAKKIKKYEFDIMVGPEVKVVPLLQELSNILKHKRYVVMRKNVMGYMVNPVSSKSKPSLVLDGQDVIFLKGKKVVIIDDVVTTGKTIKVIHDFLKEVGAEVVATAAVLKQGEDYIDEDSEFIFLDKLPIFKK